MVLAHNIKDVERTNDIQINHEVRFDSMMLSSNVLKGLITAGFSKPSPIQLLGIPIGKLGLDLILEAKSGTGKTVVFTTIALEKLHLNNGLQVIIVTPTREIAAQICDVFKQIGSHCQGLIVEVVIGGLPYQNDIEKFKNNVHVVIGTPGRLKFLIKDKHIDTRSVRLFILDEADKLVDKSFVNDIKFIHSALPRQKQVILSSATFPDSVEEILNELVQNPQRVCPDNSNVLIGVSHRITFVKYNSNSVRQTQIRFEELNKILREIQFKQCVIFCKYQARVSQLHKMLTKEKWPSELVYGKQDQTIRLEALKTLQEYKCRILISTDLVSRGIDAKNVDLVINFEPPDNSETYLHRIGRSGRYGSIGMAVSIIVEGEESKNFYKLLEPIAYTINLQHFWTGEILDCSQNTSTSLVENQMKTASLRAEENNNTSDSLWKSLAGDITSKHEVESFEELCGSFKTENKSNILENSKIESFAELFDSFTQTEIIATDDLSLQPEVVQCSSIDYKSYLDKARKIKEQFENTEKESDISSDKFKIQTQKLSESYIEPQYSIDPGLSSEPDKIENKTKNSNLKNLLNEGYVSNSTFVDQLPKNFSNPKRNNSLKKESLLYNQNHVNRKDILRENNDSSNVRGPKTFHSEQYYEKSVNTNENWELNSPIFYKKGENQRKIKRSLPHLQNKNNNELNNYSSNNQREKDYYRWYNNLKATTKQIEQILYIQELSKAC